MARILVLEDDTEFALNLCSTLAARKHQVDWRATASEARTLMEDARHDLLICDIYIYKGGKIVPDGGLALIGWIRNASFSKDFAWLEGFPILAISGAVKLPGNQHILDIATSIGADRTLAKPFGDEKLLTIIDELLRERAIGA